MMNNEARPTATHHAAKVAVIDPPLNCEATAYCPGCGTFETVWFINGHLMETQKFTESGQSLYHGCGTSVPCRLYRPR